MENAGWSTSRRLIKFLLIRTLETFLPAYSSCDYYSYPYIPCSSIALLIALACDGHIKLQAFCVGVLHVHFLGYRLPYAWGMALHPKRNVNFFLFLLSTADAAITLHSVESTDDFGSQWHGKRERFRMRDKTSETDLVPPNRDNSARAQRRSILIRMHEPCTSWPNDTSAKSFSLFYYSVDFLNFPKRTTFSSQHLQTIFAWVPALTIKQNKKNPCDVTCRVQRDIIIECSVVL